MRGDLLVHHRLRERRLVAFVVAVAPVADQVDQEVAPEPRAVLPRQARRLEAGDRIVGVDVDDRDLEAARQAAGVAGAVGLGRRGREPELVVGDDVDRAAGVVAGAAATGSASRRRCPGPGNAASPWISTGSVLAPSKRGAPGWSATRAGGARHADDHRVHGLEVARVRRHRHVHLPARRRGAGAGVVLHVAHPARDRCRSVCAATGSLNSARICAYGFSQHVRQHVQPAAVRHADQRVPHAAVGRAADDLVEDRHQHVEPFDREPRLAGEGPVQEPLEDLDLGDAVEQRLGARRDPSAAGSGPTRRRGAATRAPRARTRARSRSRSSSSRRAAASRSPRRRWPTISATGPPTSDAGSALQVVVGDAVRARRERRIADRRRAERVELRREMAVAADRLGQVGGADDDVDVGGGAPAPAPGRRRVGGRPRLEHRRVSPGRPTRGPAGIARTARARTRRSLPELLQFHNLVYVNLASRRSPKPGRLIRLMIRLIGIDVDGTLLDSEGQLPAANRDAIHAAVAAGIHVALVTGRSYPFARPVAEPLPAERHADRQQRRRRAGDGRRDAGAPAARPRCRARGARRHARRIATPPR